MKRPWLLPAVLCCVCSSSLAEARELPLGCQATRDARAFQVGYEAGGSLVRQAWARVRDCDRVEEVESAVLRALGAALPASAPSNSLQCRFAGISAGAMAQIDGLLASCADSCFLEGQFLGQVAAVAYCELSILLDGLGVADYFVRGPVAVCGLAFEVACDESFVSESIAYANGLGPCLPYTRAPFARAFDQTRENQCAYNPIDPEEDP